MPDAAVATLRGAYVFLRNVEHRLQYRDDRQTQRCPPSAEESAALARAAGFAERPSFDRALAAHRDAVSAQFDAAFGGAAEPATAATSASGRAVDLAVPGRRSGETTSPPKPRRRRSRRAGFDDPADLIAELARLRASRRYVALPALSRQRVDDLVPRLLEVAAAAGGTGVSSADDLQAAVRPPRNDQPAQRLSRAPDRAPADPAPPRSTDGCVELGRRLPDAPSAAARRTARRARAARRLPDADTWRSELARLMHDNAGDAERQMDALRHFQHAQTFRLLAQDLAGLLTVERLADHLSALADVILAATLVRGMGRR